MTERDRETMGSGPGGAVVPDYLLDLEGGDDRVLQGDLEEVEDDRVLLGSLGRVEDRLIRVEALLGSLGEKVPDRYIVERVIRGLSENVSASNDRIVALTATVGGLGGVPPDLARKFDVEDVLRNQRNEFGYLKECMAWQRGAVTTAAQVSGPRSGGAAFAWAITGALFGVVLCGALAIFSGVIDVDRLRGVSLPEPGPVSRVERRGPFVGVMLDPGTPGVRSSEGVQVDVQPDNSVVSGRRDALSAPVFVESDPVEASPGVVERAKPVLRDGGPEEYLGGRLDAAQ